MKWMQRLSAVVVVVTAIVGAASSAGANSSAGDTAREELAVQGGSRAHCAGTFNFLADRWSAENNALDSVGGQNGTFVGDVAFAPGVVGSAFLLDGSGYISVPDSSRLDLTGQYTLAAWVRYGDTSTFLGIIAKRPDFAGASLANYGVNVQQNIGLGAYYDDPNYYGVGDDNNEFEIVRIPSPASNQWFHFAASVHQKATHLVLLRLYINGRLVASRLMPGELATSVNDVPLTIGASTPDGGEPFVGLLDEVSIYNQALTGGQIRQLQQAQAAGRRC